MGRNGFVLTLIFWFLIVSDCSSSLNLRKSIDVEPNNKSSSLNISSLASPNESKTSSIGGDLTVGDKPKSLNEPTKVNPKVLKNDGSKTAASENPVVKKETKDENKNQEKKEKTNVETNSQSGGNVSCEGATRICSFHKIMTACIQQVGNGSKDLVLLVHNEGEITLKVNITIPTSAVNLMNKDGIAKNQTEKIYNISAKIGQSKKIVLKAENKECVLHISEGTFSQWLLSYYNQPTPIHGAYLLFLIALFVGGIWICCKFRKRRQVDGGVPYQELEMGLPPESASAVDVEAAQGWDEGWDDDWDEDKAVKSPGGRRVGSISANGLTVRSTHTNRDGWGKDWDD